MATNCKTVFRAIERGDAAFIQQALAQGPALVNGEYCGRTPLHFAAVRGDREIVKVLLAAGANLRGEDRFGQTPLHCAACWGHGEIVELLLAAGANPKIRSHAGETPLDAAVRQGHSEIVRMLIAAGADPCAQSKTGWTALHSAANHGCADIVNMLIAAGANPQVKDKQGRTAMDLGASKAEIGASLRGAEEDWSRPFILQLSAEGAELSFRTLSGAVAATLTWDNERPVGELPDAVRAAIQSSGFAAPWRCDYKFVLPSGAVLQTEPGAASLAEQVAVK